MRVLLTGSAGQLGRALLESVPSHVELRAATRLQLDISDRAAVEAAVAEFRPDVIINSAAYTAVDKAESEPQLAAAINADGPRLLAEAASQLANCRLIHVSTDYVFDGRSGRPYLPTDPTNPLGVYGKTKRDGEIAVLRILGKRAAVVRTAWVYSPIGRNFLLTMLRLMRDNGAVRVVSDQFGSPTSTSSIAMALWRLASLPSVDGILHWVDAGIASWYEFAVAIAEEATAGGLLAAHPSVTAIGTKDYPTAARRPTNSALDVSQTIAKLDVRATPWRSNLREALARLSAAGA